MEYSPKGKACNGARWSTPLIPTLKGELKQEGHEFQVSLGHPERLKSQKQQTNFPGTREEIQLSGQYLPNMSKPLGREREAVYTLKMLTNQRKGIWRERKKGKALSTNSTWQLYMAQKPLNLSRKYK